MKCENCEMWENKKGGLNTHLAFSHNQKDLAKIITLSFS